MARDPRTYAIIGAAMEVHRELGPGFLEAVYHEAMMIEMEKREIPFLHEVELPLFYKGRRLKTTYRADFICYGEIVVELKALSRLSGKEESQIIHYLKTTQHEVGLLLNFGTESLQYDRYISSQSAKSAKSADKALNSERKE